MARGADPRGSYKDPYGEDEIPVSRPLDRVLRGLEALIFCCLAALVIFWLADRIRSVDFEPILVNPCTGAGCVPFEGNPNGRPWAVFTDALQPREVTSFSGNDMCVRLASLIQTQGMDAPGVDLITELMVSRGMVVITRTSTDDAAQTVFAISPGARNDSIMDALRDAVGTGPTRGCHSMNYKPVFWPLFLAWLALASLRAFRSRQAVWATR